MIRRIRNGWPAPTDGKPYVLDIRTFDIPKTIANTITNATPGLVAVSLRPVGRAMIIAAERAARRRNIRIIWVDLTKSYFDI